MLFYKQERTNVFVINQLSWVAFYEWNENRWWNSWFSPYHPYMRAMCCVLQSIYTRKLHTTTPNFMCSSLLNSSQSQVNLHRQVDGLNCAVIKSRTNSFYIKFIQSSTEHMHKSAKLFTKLFTRTYEFIKITQKLRKIHICLYLLCFFMMWIFKYISLL